MDNQMNQNGRRERSESIVEFAKKQKSSIQPNGGWYNNFYNEPPGLVMEGIDYSATVNRDALMQASHLIRAPPTLAAPPPLQAKGLAPCRTIPSSLQRAHQQPVYPTNMEHDRQDTTQLTAVALVPDDAYMTRGLRSNSVSSHDSWNMPNESYQDAAHHYDMLQARKRQQNSMVSMHPVSPMCHTMSQHGSVPMGQFHVRARMPHPFPSYPTSMSGGHGTSYPCPQTVVRFPFIGQTLGDVWPVHGSNSAPTRGTSRRPVQGLPALMANSNDHLVLSPHQVFLRMQIEIFAASIIDTSTHMRGRNKAIQLHQVGIRCRYCAHVPISQRQKGHAYYPATLLGLYQAAQNMSTNHMQCGLCKYTPDAVKQRFADLIPSKNTSSGCGRTYWANTARDELGLIDTDDGIFVGCDQNDL